MTIREKFERFDAAHPEVYAALVELARRWVQAGGTRWSIWAAFNVLRWERRMAGLPDPEEDFKLSNNYTSLYSRKIMANEADLDGLFVTKPQTAAAR